MLIVPSITTLGIVKLIFIQRHGDVTELLRLF